MASSLSFYMGYPIRRIALIAAVSSGLGLFFFFYLQYSETGTIINVSKTVSGIIVSLLIGTATGFAATYLNNFLDRIFPWHAGFAGRFLLGYVAQVLCIAL